VPKDQKIPTTTKKTKLWTILDVSVEKQKATEQAEEKKIHKYT